MGYGAQMQVLRKACTKAEEDLNISCELIDLRTLLPWDVDTVAEVTQAAFLLLTLSASIVWMLGMCMAAAILRQNQVLLATYLLCSCKTTSYLEVTLSPDNAEVSS